MLLGAWTKTDAGWSILGGCPKTEGCCRGTAGRVVWGALLASVDGVLTGAGVLEAAVDADTGAGMGAVIGESTAAASLGTTAGFSEAFRAADASAGAAVSVVDDTVLSSAVAAG